MNTNAITTWDELMSKQGKEKWEHMNGYLEAFEKMQKGKKTILDALNTTEEKLSPELKEKFKEDNEHFREEWSLTHGRKSKALAFQHQKEIDALFARKLEIDQQRDRFAHSNGMEKTH